MCILELYKIILFFIYGIDHRFYGIKFEFVGFQGNGSYTLKFYLIITFFRIHFIYTCPFGHLKLFMIMIMIIYDL